METSEWKFREPVTAEIAQALDIRTDRKWLEEGVPLWTQSTQMSVCTDASLLGWGAHLLPSFCVAQGVWSSSERDHHMAGNDGSLESSTTMGTRAEGQGGDDLVRQYKCGLVQQEPRECTLMHYWILYVKSGTGAATAAWS